MGVPPQRRSALIFALDTSGGPEVVYRVAVYLQDLVRQLQAAPGLLSRARIDLLLGDGDQIQTADLEGLLALANTGAAHTALGGLSLRLLTERITGLLYEDGGFHLFILMTRDLAPGWQADLADLHHLVASVTGLVCGPHAISQTARQISKGPGGTRIVNPLDTIRLQFDSIAAWLIDHFADRPVAPPHAPPSTPAGPSPVAVPPQAVSRHPSRPQWQVREPDDRQDPTPHEVAFGRPGLPGWALVGASRRGKLHAHEGRYRDDAFALGTTVGWHLLAVADGAGSCRLSRVGARVAVEAALAGMANTIAQLDVAPQGPFPAEAVRQVAAQGLQTAHAAVHREARHRQIAFHDLSATLLIIAHHPPTTMGGDHVIAAGQVGDGLIILVADDMGAETLGEANIGLYSGETIFLTSLKSADLLDHAWSYVVPSARMVLAMTDGIADDLFPAARQIPELLRGIAGQVLPTPDPPAALLHLIGYEKRDSADDRTLATLYRQEGGR